MVIWAFELTGKQRATTEISHNELTQQKLGCTDEYFVPLSSIHYYSTRLATSKKLFLPRVNSSSGKCSLKFIGPKVWSSIPDDIKFSTTFTFKWKLKKQLLFEKKFPMMNSSNISLVQITKYWVFRNSAYFLCIFTFSYFLCAHSMLFCMKVHFLVFFLFCFVFLCTSLISFL